MDMELTILSEIAKQGFIGMILAYNLYQQTKIVKRLFYVIEKNTEAFIRLESKLDNPK